MLEMHSSNWLVNINVASHDITYKNEETVFSVCVRQCVFVSQRERERKRFSASMFVRSIVMV